MKATGYVVKEKGEKDRKKETERKRDIFQKIIFIYHAFKWVLEK